MRIVALIGLVGCGTAAPPAARIDRAPAPPIAAVAVAETGAVAPPAGWVDVTGATWEDFVEALAPDVGWALARTLLTERGLDCPRTVIECGESRVDDPQPAETSADPCLRRVVVQRLLGREGALPADVLAAATASATDADLMAQAAFDRPAEQQIALAAAVEAAGGTAEFLSSAVIPADLAAAAVTRLHLAAAVEHVDGRRDPDVLLAVIDDPTYPVEVRVDAMFTIEMYATGTNATATARAAGQRLAALAEPMLADPDCRLAAKAAEVRLDLVNDEQHVPRRPRTRDRATMLRALCVVLHYQGGNGEVVLDTFVPAAGLEVVYPLGRPHKKKRKPKREIMPRNDKRYGHLELRNFLQDWLGIALDQLAGKACAADACNQPTVELELSRDRSGELVLSRVVIRRNLAGERIEDRAEDQAEAARAECDEGD